MDETQLGTFHKDDTLLSAPTRRWRSIPRIPFATGEPRSMGCRSRRRQHGGCASIRPRPGRVFCLTSDGEWNEGSTWEGLVFAKQRSLANLTILVDVNGLQGFGTTKVVATTLAPLAEKFRALSACPTVESRRPRPRTIAGDAGRKKGVRPL